MALLVLLALSAASTFVPALPEVTAVSYVEKVGWNPFLVAALCALGQSLAFGLLYFGGELVMLRWARLARQVDRVRLRYADHLEERFLVLTVFASTVGLPPAIALAALAPGFRVPFWRVMSVLYIGRVARFLVLIFFGHHITLWWQHLWL